MVTRRSEELSVPSYGSSCAAQACDLAFKCFDRSNCFAGDAKAGSIRLIQRAEDKKPAVYRIHINRNHPVATQFTTLAHELGHLFLGHLGPDKKLNVPKRVSLTQPQQEFEAESVAYLVCERNGIKSKSQTYLSNYIDENSTIDTVDLYQIMRAAGQVESLLGLNTQKQLF